MSLITRRSLVLAAPALILPRPSAAQVGMPPVIAPIFPAYSAVTREVGGTSNSGTSGVLNFTSGSLSFGTPGPERFVVAALEVEGNTVFASVVIGGVTATRQVQANNSASRAEIYIAAVPSGATGTVAITGDGSNQFTTHISVYALHFNRTLAANATASSIAGPPSTTIAVTDNSVVIGLAVSTNSTFQTWSGLTSDNTLSSGVVRSNAGSNSFAVANASIAISATGGGGLQAMALAAWGQ